MINYSIELVELNNTCEDIPWLPMMVRKLYPKNRKIMQILKMFMLKNFLLEPMIFLYRNEAEVMRYSSTSDFGSSGAKRGTVPYRY